MSPSQASITKKDIFFILNVLNGKIKLNFAKRNNPSKNTNTKITANKHKLANIISVINALIPIIMCILLEQ